MSEPPTHPPPAPAAARPPLPPAVWLLSWVSFFADVSGEIIYPILPLFLVSELGSSKTQLGAIEGAAILLVSIMAAFAGFRSDRSGRRVIWIQIGYGLPVLGKAVIALAGSWGIVLAGRLLDRFGKGMRGAPRDAIIAGAVGPEDRGRAFGLHRALDTAGALLGVLLAAALVYWLTGSPAKTDAVSPEASVPGWALRVIIGVGAGLGLASWLLTFLVREPEAKPPDQPAAPALALPSGRVPLPRAFWVTLGVLGLFALAGSSDAFMLLRAADLGWSPWAVVLLYALYNLSYAALSYPAGVLSDRLGRWGVIGVGWSLYALVYLGFALVPVQHAWALWPIMAVYGASMAMTEGVNKALIADVSPKARRGAALGLFHAMNGLATLAASLLAGLAWDHSGPRAAFLIGAAFAALAVLALGAFRLVNRSAPPPSIRS